MGFSGRFRFRVSFGGIVAVAAIAVFAAVALSCAMTQQAKSEKRPDGTYKLTCEMSLPRCLVSAEEICQGTRYVVIRAADHHDYIGPQISTGDSQVRRSEAVIRCGPRGRPLWGSDADPMAAPEPASGADAGVISAAGGAAGTPRVCVPGATQACTGRAACAGGQSCLPDGSGFSPCDCGNSTASDGALTAPQGGAAPALAPPPTTPPTPRP